MNGQGSLAAWLTALLALAEAHPRETALALGALAILGWIWLPKRTRRKIRRSAWRRLKASGRWAWRHITTPAARRRPARHIPPPPPPAPGGPTTLYRHFAADRTLLYVGITGTHRTDRRDFEHQETKHWWPQVAYTTREQYPTRDDAEYAEAVAIRDENPLYNICRPDPANIGRA